MLESFGIRLALTLSKLMGIFGLIYENALAIWRAINLKRTLKRSRLQTQPIETVKTIPYIRPKIYNPTI